MATGTATGVWVLCIKKNLSMGRVDSIQDIIRDDCKYSCLYEFNNCMHDAYRESVAKEGDPCLAVNKSLVLGYAVTFGHSLRRRGGGSRTM